MSRSWSQYCEDIGISKRHAKRINKREREHPLGHMSQWIRHGMIIVKIEELSSRYHRDGTNVPSQVKGGTFVPLFKGKREKKGKGRIHIIPLSLTRPVNSLLFLNAQYTHYPIATLLCEY